MKGHNFDHGKGIVCKKCGQIHLSPMLGKHFSPMLGKHHSLETRQRMSIIRKGRHVSEETRHKLSIARTGRHSSEETCQRISVALKASHARCKQFGEKQITLPIPMTSS